MQAPPHASYLRAYPRLPETDPKGRELDPRMVDDELRREQMALQARATEIEEASGIRPRAKMAVGDPAASLIEAAEERAPERTLIAVGSRGLGAVQRLRLGSVSTKVLRAAKGPVLVVYPGTDGTRRQGEGHGKIGDKATSVLESVDTVASPSPTTRPRRGAG